VPMSITHIYALPGFYTINATGSQEGDTFSNSAPVTVAQQPPVALTVNPTTASVGVPFTFTITPTVGALIQNVTIDYGDGTADVLGAISQQTTRTHAYSTGGRSFNVVVTQREANGNQTTASVTVTVTS
jgi:PKD repeat protein